jgi:hypothetical protein
MVRGDYKGGGKTTHLDLYGRQAEHWVLVHSGSSTLASTQRFAACLRGRCVNDRVSDLDAEKANFPCFVFGRLSILI